MRGCIYAEYTWQSTSVRFPTRLHGCQEGALKMPGNDHGSTPQSSRGRDSERFQLPQTTVDVTILQTCSFQQAADPHPDGAGCALRPRQHLAGGALLPGARAAHGCRQCYSLHKRARGARHPRGMDTRVLCEWCAAASSVLFHLCFYLYFFLDRTGSVLFHLCFHLYFFLDRIRCHPAYGCDGSLRIAIQPGTCACAVARAWTRRSPSTTGSLPTTC